MKDWQQFLKNIENEFKANKPNFLRKNNIKRTVHPNDGGQNIYQYVKELPYFNFAADPPIGKPDKRFPKKNSTHSKTAVQSVWHIEKIRRHFGTFVKDLDLVTDIGAGYGHLCYSFWKCGFVGEYHLIDFGVMHKMQSYFLDQAGVPNCKFNKLGTLGDIPKKPKSLLFASYSINEMPMAERERIEPFYKDYKYIMIVYKNNSDFGVNNQLYFEELKNKLSDTHNVQIVKDQFGRNDNILIGAKK